jgi:hypothetical protein
VDFEDRQDLLGHKNGRITTHYSNAKLTNLILAANKVCDMTKGLRLTLLRMKEQGIRSRASEFARTFESSVSV